MKISWLLHLILLVCIGYTSSPVWAQSGFIKGLDISFMQQVEDNGGVYKEDGLAKDPLQIFKDHDINYIRLRLWHTPAEGYNNLDKTLVMASRIKEMGFKLLLNFHYSDWWADPGTQTKPQAWLGISFDVLKDSVYQYSSRVISLLKAQNTLPDMVQVGNEIQCGMLWEDGHVCDQANPDLKWQQLAELINEGIRGVKESLAEGDSIPIMIHNWDAGDNGGNRWYLDNIISEGVNFDILGQSYYPWWHGTLSEVETNLNDLATRYGKEIIVVETAYPWTLDWFDGTNNIIGSSGQLHTGYAASAAGQKAFLIDLQNIIKNVPDQKGIGVFYWAAAWISAPTFGSAWENVAPFDFDGNVLSSIEAFDSLATHIPDAIPHTYSIFKNYPNPFNATTIIEFRLDAPSPIRLEIFNTQGQKIKTLYDDVKPAGTFYVKWDGSDDTNRIQSSGLYFGRLQVRGESGSLKMLLLK